MLANPKRATGTSCPGVSPGLPSPTPVNRVIPRRVVVIGGGIVGMSAAYYCAKAGMSVTIVDPEPLGQQGCSWGNGGMIVPSHFEPLAAPGMIEDGLRMMLRRNSPFSFSARLSPGLASWMWRFWEASTRDHVERCAPVLAALHMASRRCFDELNDELGNGIGFEKRGITMLCATERGFEDERRLAEHALKLGLQAEVLTQAELKDREPGLTTQMSGAVCFEDDCHLTPGPLIDRLSARLGQLGVEFKQGGVKGFRTHGGRVEAAQTKEGEMEADAFVIAAGTWTTPLAARIGLDIPIVSGKGYSMTLANPPETPLGGLLLKEGRVAITPMVDGLRICGTLQISDRDFRINEAKVGGIKKSTCRFLPAFREAHFSGVPVWVGLRPVSADGMPFVGPCRRYPNLQIAAGHGMMGLSLGPITGKLVAQSLSGEPPEVNMTLLDPDRYA